MYQKHSEIETPNDNKIIWRYFSLEKFLSLLNDSQLYFARQDKFYDQNEAELSNHDFAFFDKIIPGISKELAKDKTGCGYINCWVMSDVELFLMWNTYSSLDKGIAVKSTVGNIIDSLDPNDKRPVFISDVKYIDYTNDFTFDKAGGSANLLARYFCKSKYFKQENELRLVYHDYQANLNDENVGLKFDVFLDTLIDEIWIAPQATEWFKDLVISELKLRNIDKPVKRSQINSKITNNLI